MGLFRTKSFGKPWLQKTHKNFFIVYMSTAIAHLWIAVNGIFGQDKDFISPGLTEVNKFADHTTWGYWSAIIGLGLVVSLFSKPSSGRESF